MKNIRLDIDRETVHAFGKKAFDLTDKQVRNQAICSCDRKYVQSIIGLYTIKEIAHRL